MVLIVQPGVTIPTTTPPIQLNVISDDNDFIQLRSLSTPKGVNPVTIDGIEGNLSIDGSFNIFFTRTTAGTAKTLTRPTTIITSGSKRKGNVLVIWMGQNGMSSEGGCANEQDLEN